MSIRGIARRATPVGYATATNAPIYVDSDDNSLRVIPAGTGSTEVSLVTSATAGAFRFAAGTGTLVTGSVVVQTGLTTVLGFNAFLTTSGTFATGATEVSVLRATAIATGAVTVGGVFNIFTTGSAAPSVSGTSTFAWIAVGT